MLLSQSGIALLYFYALALGGSLGLFFDLIRFPRLLFTREAEPKKEGKKSSLRKRRVAGVFVFLEDFLFCIVSSVCVILLFYEHNNGKIRPLVFLILLAGFLLYWATIGRWVRKFLRFFVKWIRKVISKAFLLVWKPTKRILKAIWKALQKQLEKGARKRNTKRLLRLVALNAAGLLPDGTILKKKEVPKNQGGAHGGGKRKKDHRPKQKSVA
ncbi:MAG: hypothetical protein E7680_07000 [Ruminococcaceae bacterium]|nr:hypothetical protein [Oscillospiraceae bacterium]